MHANITARVCGVGARTGGREGRRGGGTKEAEGKTVSSGCRALRMNI